MRQAQRSQYNSNTGVVSSLLDGRVDLAPYQFSCRQADNFLLSPFGILVKRPGTHRIANTKGNAAEKLWEFQYDTQTGYIIQVGDGYMRFIKDGAQIMDGASPYEIVSPYGASDIADLQYRQINDVTYITHPNYAPRKLTRTTTTTFSIAEAVFDLPPFRDRNITATTITPSANTGTITLEASEDTFTPGNVGGYYRLGQKRAANSVKKILKDISIDTANKSGVSDWITINQEFEFRTTGRWGGVIQIIRENPVTLVPEVFAEFDRDNGNGNIDRAYEIDEQARFRISFTHRAREGDPSKYQPDDDGQEDSYAYIEATNTMVYGYAKVTAYTSPTEVTATVIDNFYNTTATDEWYESSWSPRRGYPKTCTVYEERVFYAANEAQPLHIWGSVSGDFDNFRFGILEDDGLSYEIQSTERNPIEWIAAQKAIIVANGKEFGVLSSGADDTPLTPANRIFRTQQSIGFSSRKPELIDNVLVGVERNGRRLREIAYNFNEGLSGGYQANDLNRLNDEIAESGIVEIAYSQLREPYLYCVMTDGTMGVLHYNRADEIVGWSKFIAGGGGLYESVAVIRGTDNDEVYVIVKRTINGNVVRFVERFNPIRWSGLENAYFVDAGVTYDGAATDTITGASHLDGIEKQVLADGAVITTGVFDGDELTLPAPASKVHFGLGYEAKWRPMRMDIDATYGNSQGRQKKLDEIIVRVKDSKVVKFGFGSSEPSILPMRTGNDIAGDPYPLKTGEYRLSALSTFGDNFDANDPDPYILSDLPLPLTLIVTIFKYSIAER